MWGGFSYLAAKKRVDSELDLIVLVAVTFFILLVAVAASWAGIEHAGGPQ